MFKISPVQDESIALEVARICEISRIPGAFVYQMRDIESDELMAISQFEILGSSAVIYDIRAVKGLDDDEAMFILARQSMNFIDMCGAHFCKALPATADAKFLARVGFKSNENGYECNMTGMFDGNCGHH